MKITTLRIPEPLYGELKAEAEENGLSFSEYARELFRSRNGVKNTQANTNLEERLTALEQRVGSLESTDSNTSQADSIRDDFDRGSGEEEIDEGSASVGAVVEDFAQSNWEDSETRLVARKAAARAVLERAVNRAEGVGKSDVEDLYKEFDVPGQSFETWWRKNARPILKEYGEYDAGGHSYRVDSI